MTNIFSSTSSMNMHNNYTNNWYRILFSNSSDILDAGTVVAYTNEDGYATELHIRDGELRFKVLKGNSVIANQSLCKLPMN